jgi:hypothetical protein
MCCGEGEEFKKVDDNLKKKLALHYVYIYIYIYRCIFLVYFLTCFTAQLIPSSRPSPVLAEHA